MAKAIEDLAKIPITAKLKRNEASVLNQFTNPSKQRLEQLFKSNYFTSIPKLRRKKSELAKSEFVLLVLKFMSKIDEKDVYILSEMFDSLDNEGKGSLN